MAKKFFFVCSGILMLALAYHFGAGTATAQAPSNPVVGVSFQGGNSRLVAITQNGDSYISENNGQSWLPAGNCFSGGGVTTSSTATWGSVKVQAR